jgi:ferredoxin-NADP reductase
MPRFPSKLIDGFEVAEGTMAFAFARPAGFDFTAGQFLTITLPDPAYNDEKGNRRTFSIASPPQDTGRLLIATRMTGSALKRSLAEAPLGTPVSLFGPSGCFTLHENPAVPAVFVAGGIGITPFRSILHDAASRRLPPAEAITQVYSNRTPEGAAFYAELLELAGRLSCLRFLPTMTQADASGLPWTGERRKVSAEFLRDVIGDVTAPIFYIAGPPGLVAAVSKVVIEAGADAAHVRSEEFEGY